MIKRSLLVLFVYSTVTVTWSFMPRYLQRAPSAPTQVQMGVFDSISNFLGQRDGDFVKLDRGDDSEFGPGPILLLYNVPDGIADDEIDDMISDGAPRAHRQRCKIFRIRGDEDDLLDLSLGQGLNSIQDSKVLSSTVPSNQGRGVPVLLFSGFRNDEMMATYNIIGQEIYAETQGSKSPACAKAVPNSMDKPLRQVIEEISGDHLDAMQETDV